MSIELKVFKLFCNDIDIYKNYNAYISILPNIDSDISIIYNIIDNYYNKYKDSLFITKDDLLDMYELMYKNHKSKEVHISLINTMFDLQSNKDLILDYIEQLIERSKATQMIQELLPVTEGRVTGKLLETQKYIDEYIQLLRNPPVEIGALEPATLDIRDLAKEDSQDPGFEWPGKKLTATIGRIKRGTLGLIFAPVDGGKSSFGYNACAAFSWQIGQNEQIVYCGNEENKRRMAARQVGCLINKPKSFCFEYPDKAHSILKKTPGWKNIHIFDGVTHVNYIQELLERYRPRILFIDQGTNVDISLKSNKEIDRFKKVFRWYRNKANEFDCAIVTLAQANAVKESQQWLTLNDIYGSKVDIPGALDYAIGIGSKDTPTTQNIRYINVCKNKMHNGEKKKFQLYFNYKTCRFKDI